MKAASDDVVWKKRRREVLRFGYFLMTLKVATAQNQVIVNEIGFLSDFL